MIERYKFQNNFDKLGSIAPGFMSDEAKQHEESSKNQEQNQQNEEQEISDRAAMRRGLRDSVMKQQLGGGTNNKTFSRSNSMLQELKNIQQEKRLSKQLTCDINYGESRSPLIGQSEHTNNFQNSQSQNNNSAPPQLEHTSYADQVYITSNPISQFSEKLQQNTIHNNPEVSSLSHTDHPISTNENNYISEGHYKNSNLQLNLNQFSNLNYIPSIMNPINNNINNNNNNNNSSTNNAINEMGSPFSDSPLTSNSLGLPVQSNKKRNFIHKQVLGVLEQEGYIVEVDDGTKQLDQLRIIEAQRQLVRQASMEFETSNSKASLGEIEEVSQEKDSSMSRRKENKMRMSIGNNSDSFSPTQKENKDSESATRKTKNFNSSEKKRSDFQLYQSQSDRNIPSAEDLEEKVNEQQQNDRRFSVNTGGRSDRRSLLRTNIFHTQVISKTPTSSTSDRVTHWGQVENHEDEIKNKDNNENSNSDNEKNKDEDETSSIDKYFKSNKFEKLEKIELKQKFSSSSSESSLSDEENDRRKSCKTAETNIANCGGGESTRNRSMRMNVGWNTVCLTQTTKNNNSSEGDDEEDNRSDNNTRTNASKQKKIEKYKTFSKNGTMELDQDSDSSNKKRVEKINLNLQFNEKHDSYGDDEEQSGNSGSNSGYNSDEQDNKGSKSARNGSYSDKFQKYYPSHNNNFQFDSIEEMESSQESIKKSSTKTSQKIKYPGTTRPKTDNPSSFFQYINMRKSKRQRSNLTESADNLQNSCQGSPDINFSGVMESFNESIIDINVDHSQILKSSSVRSPVSPSKQHSSSSFQFSLNQVRFEVGEDPKLNAIMCKQTESECTSPQSEKDSQQKQSDTYPSSSQVPSMMKLPNSQALINNYLSSAKDLQINNTATISNNNLPGGTEEKLSATVEIMGLKLNQESENTSDFKLLMKPEEKKQELTQQFEALKEHDKIQTQVQDQQHQKQQDYSQYIKDYISSISPKLTNEQPQAKLDYINIGQSAMNSNSITSEQKLTSNNDYLSSISPRLIDQPYTSTNDYLKNLNQVHPLESINQQQSSSYKNLQNSDFKLSALSNTNNLFSENSSNTAAEQKQTTPQSLKYDILQKEQSQYSQASSINQTTNETSNLSLHLQNLLQPQTLTSYRQIDKPQQNQSAIPLSSYSQSFVISNSPISGTHNKQQQYQNSFSHFDMSSFSNFQMPVSPLPNKSDNNLNTNYQSNLINNQTNNSTNINQQSTDLYSYSLQSRFTVQLTPLNTDKQQSKTDSLFVNLHGSTSPLINRPTTPLLNNPSTPLLNNPSTPLLNNPSTPLLSANNQGLVNSTTPLFNSPSYNSLANLQDQKNTSSIPIAAYHNSPTSQSKTELYSSYGINSSIPFYSTIPQTNNKEASPYPQDDLIKEDSVKRSMINFTKSTPLISETPDTHLNSHLPSQSPSHALFDILNKSSPNIQPQNNYSPPQDPLNKQNQTLATLQSSSNSSSLSNLNLQIPEYKHQQADTTTPIPPSPYQTLKYQTSLNSQIQNSPSNNNSNFHYSTNNLLTINSASNLNPLSATNLNNPSSHNLNNITNTGNQGNANLLNNNNSYLNNLPGSNINSTTNLSVATNAQYNTSSITNTTNYNFTNNSPYNNLSLTNSITTSVTHTINPSNINTSHQPTNNQTKSPQQEEDERLKTIDQIMQEFRTKIQSSPSSINNLASIEHASYLNPYDYDRNNAMTGSVPIHQIHDNNNLLNTSVNPYAGNNNYNNSFVNNMSTSHMNSPISSFNKLYSTPPSHVDLSHLDIDRQDKVNVQQFSGDKLKYNGQYKDQQKHGYGSIVYPDGSSFTGNFQNDKKSGFGKEYDKFNNLIYSGDYQDDKYNGNGTLYNHDKSNTNVNYENLSQVQNSFSQYAGQFQHGVKQGKGKLIFHNNDTFEGYFILDKPSGYGDFTQNSTGKIVRYYL